MQDEGCPNHHQVSLVALFSKLGRVLTCLQGEGSRLTFSWLLLKLCLVARRVSPVLPSASCSALQGLAKVEGQRRGAGGRLTLPLLQLRLLLWSAPLLWSVRFALLALLALFSHLSLLPQLLAALLFHKCHSHRQGHSLLVLVQLKCEGLMLWLGFRWLCVVCSLACTLPQDLGRFHWSQPAVLGFSGCKALFGGQLV